MFELDVRDEVARLTFARARQRNAIPLDGWAALKARLGEAVAGGARILILRGDEAAFCAGADLDDFAAFAGDESAVGRFRFAMRDAVEALADLPISSLAWIEGACFGAGVAVAMACDLRVAGPRARFAITPAKLGISYPQEDVARLVGLIGPGQARRLLLTAETIDASEALRIGLVEQLGDAALVETLASSIASFPGDSLAALRRAARLAERTLSDAGSDADFDRLLASDETAQRLSLRRAS